MMTRANHLLIRIHLLIASIFTFVTSKLHAQNLHPLQRSEISIGPEYAIPTGAFRAGNGNNYTLGGSYKYGIGGSIKYIYHINGTYGLSLQAGGQKMADSINRERAIPSNNFNPNYLQTEDWAKHKTFKTLGWVSLGIGIPLTFAGFVAAVASIENSRIHPGTYYTMLGAGGAITVSSIPFFILSHKYKRKARKQYGNY